MVATSSMNVLGNNCNTVTSAESVMMLKERIVERYGEIRYTFGQGGSGGSIGQHMVANTYPGLLQGLTVDVSLPRQHGTTGAARSQDCHLLLHYYTQVSPAPVGDAAQQAAVNGHEGSFSCVAWEALFVRGRRPAQRLRRRRRARRRLQRAHEPDRLPRHLPGLPVPDLRRAPAERVDARPEQALGRGFAPLAYDNVGVQYGLDALQDGKITTEQFVDLNEKIGGLDIDYHFTFGMRRQADPGATAIAYRTGAVQRRLAAGPGRDHRLARDGRRRPGDPHGPTAALRERLRNANGTDEPRHLARRHSAGGTFDVMDRWLAAVEADTSSDPLEAKIISDKPAEAVNACWVGGRCSPTRRSATPPGRTSARRAGRRGGPSAHDVAKCQLKPLDRADNYGPVPFTDLQWQRLKGAFPNGVCDYSKPAVDRCSPCRG